MNTPYIDENETLEAEAAPVSTGYNNCKLLRDLLAEPCPKVADMWQVYGKKAKALENALARTQYVEGLKKKREEARMANYLDNSLANFKALAKVNAEYDAAQSALNAVNSTGGNEINQFA